MSQVQSTTVTETTNWNHPPWPGTIVTTCLSFIKQNILVQNEELVSYHQLEEFEKDQKERGDSRPYILPASQNPSCWNPSWLSNACTNRKDPESEWLARDNSETNPATIKPQTVNHVADQFSWVPLLCCFLPLECLPNEVSCLVSTGIS